MFRKTNLRPKEAFAATIFLFSPPFSLPNHDTQLPIKSIYTKTDETAIGGEEARGEG
jgi:hypothetical protein